MKYTIDKQDQYTVLKLQEEKLDTVLAPNLKSELVTINAEGIQNLILDLGEVKYTDSSGLSAILVGNRVFSESNGFFVIANVNDHVLKNAINRGLETEDFFGFAGGREEDKYLGFVFGRNTSITLDESALLIERDEADKYRESIKPAPPPEIDTGSTSGTGEGPGVGPPSTDGRDQPPIGLVAGGPTKKQFYGTISLEPVNAKMDFATLVDEVLEQFT